MPIKADWLTLAFIAPKISGWISSTQDMLTDIKRSPSEVFNSFKAQTASMELPLIDWSIACRLSYKILDSPGNLILNILEYNRIPMRLRRLRLRKMLSEDVVVGKQKDWWPNN